MIVPFGPGGTTDLMARVLQVEFEKAIGGPIIVSNKAGADGLHVPTVVESGIEVRGTVWGGLVAPKGLPVDVRTRLQVACANATATEGYKASANRLNSPLVYRDAATFTAFAASEAKAYAAAVREFGLEEK